MLSSWLLVATGAAVTSHPYVRVCLLNRTTVRCRYNRVNFIKNIHERHPIAHPVGQGMECLLWIQPLLDILPQFRQCVQYLVLLDRVITALDCVMGIGTIAEQIKMASTRIWKTHSLFFPLAFLSFFFFLLPPSSSEASSTLDPVKEASLSDVESSMKEPMSSSSVSSSESYFFWNQNQNLSHQDPFLNSLSKK